MTETTTKRKPATRRTAQQRAEYHAQQAAKAAAAAAEAERNRVFAQQRAIGRELMALAADGNAAAAELLERCKNRLTKARERAAFGLAPIEAAKPLAGDPLPPARTAEAIDAEIAAALRANKAATGKAEQTETAARWAALVSEWERVTGKLKLEGVARQKHGFGPNPGDPSPRYSSSAA